MFALFPRFLTRWVSWAHRYCCIFVVGCSFVPSTVFIPQPKSFDRYGRCDDLLVPFLLSLDAWRATPKESPSVGKLTCLISAAYNLLVVAHRWGFLAIDVARRLKSWFTRHWNLVTIGHFWRRWEQIFLRVLLCFLSLWDIAISLKCRSPLISRWLLRFSHLQLAIVFLAIWVSRVKLLKFLWVLWL